MTGQGILGVEVATAGVAGVGALRREVLSLQVGLGRISVPIGQDGLSPYSIRLNVDIRSMSDKVLDEK